VILVFLAIIAALVAVGTLSLNAAGSIVLWAMGITLVLAIIGYLND
jgi:hypothetical protein